VVNGGWRQQKGWRSWVDFARVAGAGAREWRDCESPGLARVRERKGLDSEADWEPRFCRACWNDIFSLFFIFLPMENEMERLLELL
jgi:sugar/nucleoside kinase (ribokinase family)